MSDWVKRKEEWLLAIAADKRLHEWTPLAIAVVLASYLNNRSEEAWPGIERLSADLQTDRRSCQRALDRLVEAGFLRRRRGGGRKNTNRYSIKGGLSTAGLSDRNSGPRDRNSGPRDRKTAGYHPPEPTIEPQNNRRRTAAARQERFTGSRTRPSRYHTPAREPRATHFPDRWVFGAAEAAAASASPAQWGAERARREFGKFADWHRDRQTRSVDWVKSWLKWCEEGRKIADRDAQREARNNTGIKSGVSRAVSGVSRWYSQQKDCAAALYVEVDEEEDSREAK